MNAYAGRSSVTNLLDEYTTLTPEGLSRKLFLTVSVQGDGMYSSIISKIEKARTYAGERERVRITGFNAVFRGNHNSYQVSYGDDAWSCSCAHFSLRDLCSHTMAVQRILEGMLAREAAAE